MEIVNGLRSISQLDSPDKFVGLQEAIRESVSEPGRFKNEEQKLVLLGDKFASAPSTFKFSFGEKLMLNDAINMAKQILLEYSKQYTFLRQPEKRKTSANTTGSLIKRPRFDYVRSAGEKSAVSDEVECVASASTTTTQDPATTASTSASTINETENSAALVPLTWKGKTLHDYLMKWFMNTKLIAEKQIAFVMGDCEVISENNTIKCLKCNLIIKSHVDENGGWKISLFCSHLQRCHKITPEPQETIPSQRCADPTRKVTASPVSTISEKNNTLEILKENF
ncbi:hypothetical protein OUZ56_010706 [Daphnia magna]|uniref:BED-type domain-containing protein n=1 Tax=Daphnia magna TaxID=35525 RepID=A0ABQ9YYD3_9CRUS|nr:hypothetical protein OUZ56_010706 [Daphnia magna]